MIPRWRKVWRDLWTNKTRTLLVLLSISIGVTTIGMVLTSQLIVEESLPEAFAAVNPASATLFSLNTFDESLVETVRDLDEVAQAEGRRFVNVRFLTSDGEWRNLQIFAIPDYDNITLNLLNPQEGEYPPPDRAILLERNSFSAALGLGDVAVGDSIIMEPPDGRQREVTIAGSVHDLNQLPAAINGSGYAYATFETLEWLGEPRDYNQLVFVVNDDPATADNEQLNIDYIRAVGKDIQDRLERDNVSILFTLIFPPGEHPAQTFLDALALILGVVGVLALALSGFIIVNMLSAILAQQVRQIGIMKAIGGRSRQITLMYFALVTLFGFLALIVAVPLGAVGGLGLSSLFAGFLNFDIDGLTFSPTIILIQVALSLLAPLLAAVYPIVRGSRVTVREALSEEGAGGGQFGTSFVDRFVLGLRRVVPMERPSQISLRNTFRRKGRLTLTLITLSLASGIFIAIFSVRATLQQTLEDGLAYFDYDVQILFDRSYRAERIQRLLQGYPGVEGVETWGFASSFRVRDDGTESDTIILYAPRPDTAMLNPIIVEGRWLQEGDTNGIIINTDVLNSEEDLTLGDELTLSINGRESEFVIIGIARGVLSGPNIFMNFDYYGRVTNEPDRAQISQIRLTERSAANQQALGTELEELYRGSGFRVQQMQTISQIRTIISGVFNFIIVFLLFMAVLLGVVGGLGLMGTMSINVLERTREIGVMRAVGASDRAVLRIVLIEGLLIGLISWIIGSIIAIPASRILANQVGISLFQAAPSYVFSIAGLFIWLGTVLLLAGLASYLPARGASRLTVREVLSYE